MSNLKSTISIEQAVDEAIKEVENNCPESTCLDVKESLIFRIAESKFDNIPYKWHNGGFCPMGLRKPHSQSFYDKLSFERSVRYLRYLKSLQK